MALTTQQNFSMQCDGPVCLDLRAFYSPLKLSPCVCWEFYKVRVYIRQRSKKIKISESYHESQCLVEGIQCLQFQIEAAGKPL